MLVGSASERPLVAQRAASGAIAVSAQVAGYTPPPALDVAWDAGAAAAGRDRVMLTLGPTDALAGFAVWITTGADPAARQEVVYTPRGASVVLHLGAHVLGRAPGPASGTAAPARAVGAGAPGAPAALPAPPVSTRVTIARVDF